MKNTIFFSVYRNKSTDSVNHRKVFRQLNELNPVLVLGRYSGVNEKSLMLPIEHLSLIEFIAKSYKQESILIVDSNGIGSLKYITTGLVERLGLMKQVDKSEALTQTAYSIINGKYWIVK